MEELIKKEKMKMRGAVEELLTKLLLDGFEDELKRLVIEVKGFKITDIHLDEEKSEFQNKVTVSKVSAFAEVYVDIRNGQAKAQKHLKLFTHNPFTINYNDDKKQYVLDDFKGVIIIAD